MFHKHPLVILFIAVKIDSKLILHHMGKIFIKLTEKKIQIWRVTFLATELKALHCACHILEDYYFNATYKR